MYLFKLKMRNVIYKFAYITLLTVFILPNFSYAHHPGGDPTFLWLLCHNIMHYVGDITGLGYEAANILVFLIIQPLLILLFMTLWLIERFKN